MANKKKPVKTKGELRTLRMQQIIFLALSVIIILAMVLSLAARF